MDEKIKTVLKDESIQAEAYNALRGGLQKRREDCCDEVLKFIEDRLKDVPGASIKKTKLTADDNIWRPSGDAVNDISAKTKGYTAELQDENYREVCKFLDF